MPNETSFSALYMHNLVKSLMKTVPEPRLLLQLNFEVAKVLVHNMITQKVFTDPVFQVK